MEPRGDARPRPDHAGDALALAVLRPHPDDARRARAQAPRHRVAGNRSRRARTRSRTPRATACSAGSRAIARARSCASGSRSTSACRTRSRRFARTHDDAEPRRHVHGLADGLGVHHRRHERERRAVHPAPAYRGRGTRAGARGGARPAATSWSASGRRSWREATHDLRGNLGIVKNVTQVLQHGQARGQPPRPIHCACWSAGSSALHALLDDLTIQARLDAGPGAARSLPVRRRRAARRALCGRPHDRRAARAVPARGRRGDAARRGRRGEGAPHRAEPAAQRAELHAEGGVEVLWEAVDEPPRRAGRCAYATPGPASRARQAPRCRSRSRRPPATRSRCEADARAQGDQGADGTAAPTLPSQSSGAGPAGHGEGVGLSIVKRLCELLDASVELSTAPGKGTTFRVTFPDPVSEGLKRNAHGETPSAGPLRRDACRTERAGDAVRAARRPRAGRHVERRRTSRRSSTSTPCTSCRPRPPIPSRSSARCSR